jgi:ParB family chromosome partitioning protein
VATAVAALKERGFTSPYLKAFVVARLNPLSFRRGATMSPDHALDAMMAAAAKFDAGKVKVGDLASAPAGPAEE